MFEICCPFRSCRTIVVTVTKLKNLRRMCVFMEDFVDAEAL